MPYLLLAISVVLTLDFGTKARNFHKEERIGPYILYMILSGGMIASIYMNLMTILGLRAF